MRKTGKYRMLSLTFGCLPMIAAILLTQMREDSGPALKWIAIVRALFARFIGR